MGRDPSRFVTAFMRAGHWRTQLYDTQPEEPLLATMWRVKKLEVHEAGGVLTGARRAPQQTPHIQSQLRIA